MNLKNFTKPTTNNLTNLLSFHPKTLTWTVATSIQPVPPQLNPKQLGTSLGQILCE